METDDWFPVLSALMIRVPVPFALWFPARVFGSLMLGSWNFLQHHEPHLFPSSLLSVPDQGVFQIHFVQRVVCCVVLFPASEKYLGPFSSQYSGPPLPAMLGVHSTNLVPCPYRTQYSGPPTCNAWRSLH